MEFPLLKTERTILRPIRIDDAGDFFRIYSDAESMKYRETKILENFDEALQFIRKYHDDFEKGISLRWAIEIKSTGKFAGSVVWKISSPENEIGYSLDKDLWRKGLMFEIMQTVIAWLFEDIKLKSLTARTKTGNIASQKLLEKLGFELIEKSETGKKYKRLLAAGSR